MSMALVERSGASISSSEIAELVGKRHDNVKRTIETLIEQGVIASPQIEEKPTAGRPSLEYLFVGERGKRDSIVVVAQLSPEFTARLVDRWQQLESSFAGSLRIPKSLAEALRLAADQAERIEQQQAVIEQQQPAVEYLARYVEARSTKSLREVAKVLGVKEREFIERLEEDRILFRQSGSLLPFADLQHRGLFEVKTGEANGHAFQQTRFTPKGIAWIAKRYAGEPA